MDQAALQDFEMETNEKAGPNRYNVDQVIESPKFELVRSAFAAEGTV